MAESKSAQQVREITDKLEQGIKELFESERFKEYLRTMSKFYHYSFSNTLLIAMQKPEATYVAGYTSWQRNFDRQVMKGEKGIKILAPAPYKAKEEREKIDPSTQKPVLDADGKPITETVEVMRPAFKVVSVFDISQTDGKELPDIIVDELSGSVENYTAFFEALKQDSPVPISFEDIPGGAKGYFSPIENRIAIQEGMSEIQTIKTAIHEIAHAKLHSIDRPEPEPAWKIVMISDGGTKRDFLSGFASETEANEAAEREGWRFVDENRFEWRLEVEEDTSAVQEMRKDRHTKEVEAESVAYTVCQRYGIETSDYSFGYIAGWSSDKETKELKGSLETIRKTAAEMIDSIDAKLKVLLAEKTTENEVAVSIGEKGFIEVHKTGGGFAYSLFDLAYSRKDYGFVPDPESTAHSVMESLCLELGVLDLDTRKVDYLELMKRVTTEMKIELDNQSSKANKRTPLGDAGIPVYTETADHAHVAGETDAYRLSAQANIACRDTIERTISEYYGNNRLAAESAVTSVLEKFSPERVQYVLANTVQHKDWDGRISQKAKTWAKDIPVCPELSTRFIVDKAHPGLTDLFITEFMRQMNVQERRQEAEAQTQNPEVAAWERDEVVSIEKTVVEVKAPTAEQPQGAAAPKHRLTPEEKQIRDAVMDTLKAQIAHNNDGMLSTYRSSEQSFRVMARKGVRIEGNTVTQNGEPLFTIHRRHSAKKTQGCFRELTPTLEYVRQEKKQEKPSIRDQLKAAAKSQPEKKAPAKAKSHDMEL